MIESQLQETASPIEVAAPLSQGFLARLDHQLIASKTAFAAVGTAQDRTDKQLYRAIGHLAAFVSLIGNDRANLVAFAKEHGVRMTQATSNLMAVIKLVLSNDRKKASKYATVLQYAALKGVAGDVETVAHFIDNEGGIEACLRAHRELRQNDGKRQRTQRRPIYSQAVALMATKSSVVAPPDLIAGSYEEDIFVVLGVRDQSGATRLLKHAITDERVIRSVVKSAGKERHTVA